MRDSTEEDSIDFFLCITRYARLCSRVKCLLYTATAYTSPPHAFLSIVHELDGCVESWYELVPSSLKIEMPVSIAKLPRGRKFIQAVTLHSSYKYLVCSIHCRLTRQVCWSRRFKNEQFQESDLGRFERSVEAGVKAARSIILLTRYVDVDNYTPSW